MSSPATLLDAQGIDAAYGHIRALRDVSLSVGEGQLTTVVGANGAGKTTLLKTLLGTHKPQGGRVTLQDTDVTRWSPVRRVAAGLVLVPEGRGILPAMTVLDNLKLGMDAASNRADRATPERFSLETVYERFPILSDRRDQSAGLLSGGEQQMLAIGRALLAQPRLLMLDEPSLGLAPKITQELTRLLASLRDEGLTILLVEQNVRQAMKIADSYYLMEIGKVVANGRPSDATQDSHIQAAYLGGT